MAFIVAQPVAAPGPQPGALHGAGASPKRVIQTVACASIRA